MLGGVLKSVAVMNKDNSYSLAKYAWPDVRSDWPFYTDVDRQLLKKSVQQIVLYCSFDSIFFGGVVFLSKNS